MSLNGRQIVDNNGCHGERERTSGNQWLTPGYHLVGVDMCEKGGGEAMKLRYQGPDTGNRKVKVPQSALKHEKAPERAPRAGAVLVLSGFETLDC